MADTSKYEGLKKSDLQEEARVRGLATSGSVPELVARLEDDDVTTGGGELDTSDPTDDRPVPGEEATSAADTPSAPDRPGANLTDRSATVAEETDPRGSDGHVGQTDQLLMDNPTAATQQRDELGRAPRPMTIQQLTGDEYVAVKSGDTVPVDGRYHKRFVVQARRDWETPLSDDGDLMRACYAATLQEALNRGVHPKGEVTFDGQTTGPDGSTCLDFSVEAIPAIEDEDTAGTYSPRRAIIDMGGSTIETAQVDPEQAKLAEARTQNDPDERTEPAISSTTQTEAR